MTVVAGQVWRGIFDTKDGSGAIVVPGAGPAGALYVNGVLDAAVVTVAGAAPYRWSVTIPNAAVADDTVSMRITATIAGVATAETVAEEVVDPCAVHGPGAIAFTYTVTNSITGLPIEGVEVWISTDLAGANVVWSGDTDAFGVARDDFGNIPVLDAGTYYFWRQKAGFTFVDPDVEVVS